MGRARTPPPADRRHIECHPLTQAQGVEAVAGGQVVQVGGGVAAREPAEQPHKRWWASGIGSRLARLLLCGGCRAPKPPHRFAMHQYTHQLPAFITVRERGRCTLKVERTTALGATMAAIFACSWVTLATEGLQECGKGAGSGQIWPIRAIHAVPPLRQVTLLNV